MQQTRQNLTQSSSNYHQTYMDIPLQPGQWRCMSMWCVGMILGEKVKTCPNCGGRQPKPAAVVNTNNTTNTLDTLAHAAESDNKEVIEIESSPNKSPRKKKPISNRIGKKRGKYRKVSEDAKRQLFDLYFNHDMTAKEVESVTKVKQGTIEYYTSRMTTSGLTVDEIVKSQRGNCGRKRKFTEQELDQLATWVDEKNQITDKKLKSEFRKKFKKTISKGSIYKALKERNITMKNMSQEPVERNLPENIEARKKYAQEMAHIKPEDLLFVDETGWNVKQHRRRGRSRKGKKAVIRVKNRGVQAPHISCIGAFSPVHGMVHYELLLGSTNHKVYANFITNLAKKDICKHKQFLIVHDNASIHLHQDIQNALDTFPVGHELKRLPPYSPQLNPIENVWGKVTNLINTALGDEERPEKITPYIELISHIIDSSIEPDEPAKFYTKVMQHYFDCAEGIPLAD